MHRAPTALDAFLIDLIYLIHPHLHVLCADGCFYGQGLFRVAPRSQRKDLEKLFRVKVLAMLLRKKITREFIRMLDGR